MFRYSESSCLAQQPVADEEGETWNLACQDGPPKSTVGHMFCGVTSRRRMVHDVLASPIPNPAVLN